MYRLLRRALFLVPPEQAHRLGMAVLRRLGPPKPIAPGVEGPDLSVTSAGLRLSHPITLAAGFDKDAEAVGGFFALGFSAVEVGTVTPRPQPGNPAPRLFRLPQARALINRPKLLLADEPTGNLDSRTGTEIMNLIREFNETLGMTIVMVTHERALAGQYAQRMIFLADGKLVDEQANVLAAGTPAQGGRA